MRIKSTYQISEVAGESILLLQGSDAVDTTKLLSLNKTSVWLWNTLYGSDFTLDSIASTLVQEYGIDMQLALEDAKKWLDTLQQHNLIEE